MVKMVALCCQARRVMLKGISRIQNCRRIATSHVPIRGQTNLDKRRDLYCQKGGLTLLRGRLMSTRGCLIHVLYVLPRGYSLILTRKQRNVEKRIILYFQEVGPMLTGRYPYVDKQVSAY
jgi:hypothetical protein